MCIYIYIYIYIYMCVCVNILEGSVHTVKENAEALVVATKEGDWTRSKC